MNLHEYQAKALFRQYDIPTLPGKVARSPEEAVDAARQLGGSGWVVKAQVHAGGRGKAGGVKRVDDLDAVRQTAEALLGQRLVTKQTSAAGLPVNQVLIEPQCEIREELYVAAVVNRARQRLAMMASRAGGMDIEEVSAKDPAQLHRVVIDPIVGLMPFQCRQLGFALGLTMDQVKQFGRLLDGMIRLFVEKDASLVEINPLVVTGEGQWIALDAKVNIDDNALYRHPALQELRDLSQEDEQEAKAREFGLNYIRLKGNIGCMVNGAGLAMATMDLIKLHGGEPANFLDVGGGTTSRKVAEAFKLILSDSQVKAVFVNIFGGIVRCDLIAEGIIEAIEEVHVAVPVVVRLEGTNVERGRELLRGSALAVVTAESLTDGARKVVRAAMEGRR